MGTLLDIVLVTAAVLFLLTLAGRFWRGRYRVFLGADATHYARAADGWRLALHRYRKPGATGDPVILCHGMAVNAATFDLGEALSLARDLRRAGFDVFCLELRGAGFSRGHDPAHRPPRRIVLEHFVTQDLPAAIDAVLAISGRHRLHWVGQSLGGLIMYNHLATSNDARIASFAAVCAPVSLRTMEHLRALWPFAWLASLIPPLPLRALAWHLIPLYRELPFAFLTHHGRNIPRRVMRLVLANAMEAIPRGLYRQIARGLRTRASGLEPEADALARITTPTCVVAGTRDQLFPAHLAEEAYRRLGAAIKELHVFGKETGFAGDCGHGDLLIGEAARRDVFPVLIRWLEDRRAGRITARLSKAMMSNPKTPILRPRAKTPSNPYDPYARHRRERRRLREAEAR